MGRNFYQSLLIFLVFLGVLETEKFFKIEEKFLSIAPVGFRK